MKQSEILFRAIGEVGDDLIARADQTSEKKPRPVYLRWGALAACCVLVLGIAAFASLSFSGQKGTSADTASYEVADEIAEAPRAIADDARETEVYSGTPPLPEEEMKSEPEAERETSTTAAPSARTVQFSGIRFEAVSPEGLDLRPGEQLGLAEDGSDRDLVGCAVYECSGEEPEQLILLLVDGEYLPFRSIEE